MLDAPVPPTDRLTFTSAAAWGGADGSTLARRVRRGELHRIRAGVMRPPLPSLAGADPADRAEEARRRYLELVAAVVATRKLPPILTGHAALAVWGLPVIGPWPTQVDVMVDPGSRIQSKNGVRVHRAPHGEADLARWGGAFVTTPLRTVIELARDGELTASLVALDLLLGERAPAGLRLPGKDAVMAEADRLAIARGSARLRRVVDFADGLSGSPGESLSRIGIHRAGFIAPQLQTPHRVDGGALYFTDFEWPEQHQIGEFDGIGKYLRPEFLRGGDTADAVVREKLREDALREAGFGVVRWGWAEARRPEVALAPKLLRAGIPLRSRRSAPIWR